MLVGEQLPVSGADSHYGKETVEAIKSVQTKMQMKADGIYGDETRKVLLALLTAEKPQAR
ncbi:putative peptidoglycan binding domain protein [compost metagenome]